MDTNDFYENKKNIQIEEERKELLSKCPQAALPSDIKQWLKIRMCLKQTQINSNIKLFDELYRTFGERTKEELEESFQYIANQGCRPQENIGWFIQNLKKKIENESKNDCYCENERISPKLNGLYKKSEKNKVYEINGIHQMGKPEEHPIFPLRSKG